ncbi:hypothetical protein [Marisediminicola senii]|uniref:hypothetical protein n=1 Tax=Marisediminicola senii TaxID=2711233 RepID=UPI0013EC9013|nr:hypothetical protein [Marisediminicola senii]
MATTFLVTAGVTAVVFLVITAQSNGWDRPRRPEFFLPFALGFIAASVACSVLEMPLARATASVFRRNWQLRQRILSSVKTGDAGSLTPEESWLAARYAVLASAYLPLQAAQIAFLYAGLIITQFWIYLRSTDGVFSQLPLWVIAFLVLVALVTGPVQARLIRRTRRYAAAHVDVVLDGPPVD